MPAHQHGRMDLRNTWGPDEVRAVVSRSGAVTNRSEEENIHRINPSIESGRIVGDDVEL